MRPYPKNDLNGRIFRHAQNFNILIQKLKVINKHLVKKIKQKNNCSNFVMFDILLSLDVKVNFILRNY